MQLTMQLVGSHPFNALHESYLPLPAFRSCNCATHDTVLLMEPEKNGLLWQHLAQVEKPRGSFKYCHFPLSERSQGNKFSIGPEMCHFGVVIQVESNCSSHPLQCIQTHTFAPMVSWSFSAETSWISTKVLSLVGDFLTQCFPEDPRS